MTNLECGKYKSLSKEIGRCIEITTYFQFKRNPSHYDYIFCDNVQNISENTLSIIKGHARFVIVTINPYLSFEDNEFFSQEPTLTIETVQSCLSPMFFELQHSYLKFAKSIIFQLLPNLPNKTVPTIIPKTSQWKCPIHICKAQKTEDEIDFVISHTKGAFNCGYTVGVLLPSHNYILQFIQK